jgi:hypothetical protein
MNSPHKNTYIHFNIGPRKFVIPYILHEEAIQALLSGHIGKITDALLARHGESGVENFVIGDVHTIAPLMNGYGYDHYNWVYSFDNTLVTVLMCASDQMEGKKQYQLLPEVTELTNQQKIEYLIDDDIETIKSDFNNNQYWYLDLVLRYHRGYHDLNDQELQSEYDARVQFRSYSL